jgi:hypothetical protein
MKLLIALFHLPSYLNKQVAFSATKETQEQGERAMNLQQEPGQASKQAVTSGSGC